MAELFFYLGKLFTGLALLVVVLSVVFLLICIVGAALAGIFGRLAQATMILFELGRIFVTIGALISVIQGNQEPMLVVALVMFSLVIIALNFVSAAWFSYKYYVARVS